MRTAELFQVHKCFFTVAGIAFTRHVASPRSVAQAPTICGPKPVLASGQCSESVLWGEVRPVQWNFTSAAFLVEKRNSVFAAVFLPDKSFKLTPGKRVKGMCNPKSLRFYSTNACSATAFPTTSGTHDSLAFGMTKIPKRFRSLPRNRPNAPFSALPNSPVRGRCFR
jgi:hypothetical protein